MINYIYKFIDYSGNVIYIGKTKNIKHRMMQHFSISHNKSDKVFTGHLPDECYQSVKMVKYAYVDNQLNAELYETYLINKYKPKYNTDKLYKETCFTELNFSEPIWHSIYINYNQKIEVSFSPISIYSSKLTRYELTMLILQSNKNTCKFHQKYFEYIASLNNVSNFNDDYERLIHFYNDAALFITDTQDYDYDNQSMFDLLITARLENNEDNDICKTKNIHINVSKDILEFYSTDYIKMLCNMKLINITDTNIEINYIKI